MLLCLRPAILLDEEFAAIPAVVELLRQKYDALKGVKDSQAQLFPPYRVIYDYRYPSPRYYCWELHVCLAQKAFMAMAVLRMMQH